MTTSIHIIFPKLSYNSKKKKKKVVKWDGLTLSKTRIHAGEEQEEKQGLQLHDQSVSLQTKIKKSKLCKTEFCSQKLHLFLPQNI